MVVDVAESEGEGQEVDDMLRMTQSCSIHEAENEPAAQETDKVGATIYDEVFDIESMELQYPASDDMDVDSAPMTVEDSEEERKPPDRALPPETITVEDEEDAEEEEERRKPILPSHIPGYNSSGYFLQ